MRQWIGSNCSAVLLLLLLLLRLLLVVVLVVVVVVVVYSLQLQLTFIKLFYELLYLMMAMQAEKCCTKF